VASLFAGFCLSVTIYCDEYRTFQLSFAGALKRVADRLDMCGLNPYRSIFVLVWC